jgi:hypothetical protein
MVVQSPPDAVVRSRKRSGEREKDEKQTKTIVSFFIFNSNIFSTRIQRLSRFASLLFNAFCVSIGLSQR